MRGIHPCAADCDGVCRDGMDSGVKEEDQKGSPFPGSEVQVM